MPAPRDISGQSVNDLTARELVGRNDRGIRLWRCDCVCGRSRIVQQQLLVQGKVISCGCAVCVECGARFLRQDKRSLFYCSHACKTEVRRRHWREQYHALPPERKQAMIERHKRRRVEDPDWAKGVDARKWQRVKASEERWRTARQKARDFYAKNAEVIQSRRREKLAQMSDEELESRAEKCREYSRLHIQRVRSDPQKLSRLQDYAEEYRRRGREKKALEQLAVLGSELQSRLEDQSVARRRKPCIMCGKPVVGRRECARVCSAECRRARSTQLANPVRERPCLECGEIITAKTCAKICSPECVNKRKSRSKRERTK